jgi:general secretion pathway protein E
MIKNFGDILLSKGLISEEELAKALTVQKRSAFKLGQLLVKKGTINEDDVLRVLSEQYSIPLKDELQIKNIDKLVEKVPLKFIQKYRIVPYALEGEKVYVATTDPAEIHPLDELRLLFIGYEVEPVLAREGDILRIIHSHYESNNKESETTDLEEGFEFLDSIDDTTDTMDLANQAPIIKMVNVILTNAITERASDIHIEPQERELSVRFRVDGIMHKVINPPKSIQSGVISRLKIMANMNIAENRLPQDGRIKIRFGGKDIDIRVNSLPTQFGERIVMRLLNKTDQVFDISTIGFSESLMREFTQTIKQPNGIVLITGPTGSGKTTTLYAALNFLNDEATNIITVEDPIEYQMDGISQVQAKSRIGFTFAEGLRAILRQDPDVIMVGEIRDEETARIAIQASLTGHFVFSTLHTNDAPSAVTRLLDMGIEPYMVASTCRGFMAQRLLRRLCPDCKKPIELPREQFESLGYEVEGKKKTVKVSGKHGCKECMGTGYIGRVGVYEFLPVDNEMREFLLTNPSIDAIRKKGVSNGLRTLRISALDQVILGTTSLDEALRVT